MSDLNAANAGGMNQWMTRTATVPATFLAWSAGVRCLDLTEELGELARAILIAEGRKSATKSEEPVAQARCGCCSMSSLSPSATGSTRTSSTASK